MKKFVDSAPGNAVVNFSLAAAAKKLPNGIGESNPIQYITTGLRVGSLANLGNSLVDKVLGRNKKTEEKK